MIDPDTECSADHQAIKDLSSIRDEKSTTRKLYRTAKITPSFQINPVN